MTDAGDKAAKPGVETIERSPITKDPVNIVQGALQSSLDTIISSGVLNLSKSDPRYQEAVSLGKMAFEMAADFDMAQQLPEGMSLEDLQEQRNKALGIHIRVHELAEALRMERQEEILERLEPTISAHGMPERDEGEDAGTYIERLALTMQARVATSSGNTYRTLTSLIDILKTQHNASASEMRLILQALADVRDGLDTISNLPLTPDDFNRYQENLRNLRVYSDLADKLNVEHNDGDPPENIRAKIEEKGPLGIVTRELLLIESALEPTTASAGGFLQTDLDDGTYPPDTPIASDATNDVVTQMADSLGIVYGPNEHPFSIRYKIEKQLARDLGISVLATDTREEIRNKIRAHPGAPTFPPGYDEGSDRLVEGVLHDNLGNPTAEDRMPRVIETPDLTPAELARFHMYRLEKLSFDRQIAILAQQDAVFANLTKEQRDKLFVAQKLRDLDLRNTILEASRNQPANKRLLFADQESLAEVSIACDVIIPAYIWEGYASIISLTTEQFVLDTAESVGGALPPYERYFRDPSNPSQALSSPNEISVGGLLVRDVNMLQGHGSRETTYQKLLEEVGSTSSHQVREALSEYGLVSDTYSLEEGMYLNAAVTKLQSIEEDIYDREGMKRFRNSIVVDNRNYGETEWEDGSRTPRETLPEAVIAIEQKIARDLVDSLYLINFESTTIEDYNRRKEALIQFARGVERVAINRLPGLADNNLVAVTRSRFRMLTAYNLTEPNAHDAESVSGEAPVVETVYDTETMEDMYNGFCGPDLVPNRIIACLETQMQRDRVPAEIILEDSDQRLATARNAYRGQRTRRNYDSYRDRLFHKTNAVGLVHTSNLDLSNPSLISSLRTNEERIIGADGESVAVNTNDYTRNQFVMIFSPRRLAARLRNTVASGYRDRSVLGEIGLSHILTLPFLGMANQLKAQVVACPDIIELRDPTIIPGSRDDPRIYRAGRVTGVNELALNRLMQQGRVVLRLELTSGDLGGRTGRWTRPYTATDGVVAANNTEITTFNRRGRTYEVSAAGWTRYGAVTKNLFNIWGVLKEWAKIEGNTKELPPVETLKQMSGNISNMLFNLPDRHVRIELEFIKEFRLAALTSDADTASLKNTRASEKLGPTLVDLERAGTFVEPVIATQLLNSSLLYDPHNGLYRDTGRGLVFEGDDILLLNRELPFDKMDKVCRAVQQGATNQMELYNIRKSPDATLHLLDARIGTYENPETGDRTPFDNGNWQRAAQIQAMMHEEGYDRLPVSELPVLTETARAMCIFSPEVWAGIMGEQVNMDFRSAGNPRVAKGWDQMSPEQRKYILYATRVAKMRFLARGSELIVNPDTGHLYLIPDDLVKEGGNRTMVVNDRHLFQQLTDIPMPEARVSQTVELEDGDLFNIPHVAEAEDVTMRWGVKITLASLPMMVDAQGIPLGLFASDLSLISAMQLGVAKATGFTEVNGETPLVKLNQFTQRFRDERIMWGPYAGRKIVDVHQLANVAVPKVIPLRSSQPLSDSAYPIALMISGRGPRHMGELGVITAPDGSKQKSYGRERNPWDSELFGIYLALARLSPEYLSAMGQTDSTLHPQFLNMVYATSAAVENKFFPWGQTRARRRYKIDGTFVNESIEPQARIANLLTAEYRVGGFTKAIVGLVERALRIKSSETSDMDVLRRKAFEDMIARWFWGIPQPSGKIAGEENVDKLAQALTTGSGVVGSITKLGRRPLGRFLSSGYNITTGTMVGGIALFALGGYINPDELFGLGGIIKNFAHLAIFLVSASVWAGISNIKVFGHIIPERKASLREAWAVKWGFTGITTYKHEQGTEAVGPVSKLLAALFSLTS